MLLCTPLAFFKFLFYMLVQCLIPKTTQLNRGFTHLIQMADHFYMMSVCFARNRKIDLLRPKWGNFCHFSNEFMEYTVLYITNILGVVNQNKP